MTREEYIDFANALKNNYTIDFDKLPEFCDMAISALKGFDLPDNATNNDALNYMLRQTFPRVIFIHFHNEANLTEGVVMTKEWLDSPYKGVSE
jgi:hypothetical protein